MPSMSFRVFMQPISDVISLADSAITFMTASGTSISPSVSNLCRDSTRATISYKVLGLAPALKQSKNSFQEIYSLIFCCYSLPNSLSISILSKIRLRLMVLSIADSQTAGALRQPLIIGSLASLSMYSNLLTIRSVWTSSCLNTFSKWKITSRESIHPSGTYFYLFCCFSSLIYFSFPTTFIMKQVNYCRLIQDYYLVCSYFMSWWLSSASLKPRTFSIFLLATRYSIRASFQTLDDYLLYFIKSLKTFLASYSSQHLFLGEASIYLAEIFDRLFTFDASKIDPEVLFPLSRLVLFLVTTSYYFVFYLFCRQLLNSEINWLPLFLGQEALSTNLETSVPSLWCPCFYYLLLEFLTHGLLLDFFLSLWTHQGSAYPQSQASPGYMPSLQNCFQISLAFFSK